MSSPLGPNEQSHVDLKEARKWSQIDGVAVRDFVHGGREKWNDHTNMVKIVSAEPSFDKSRRPHITRVERYEATLSRLHRIIELRDKHNWSREQVGKAVTLGDEPHPFSLHHLAFEPVVQSQSTPEFLAKYSALIDSAGIIGCYMQTELAHGSNLNSLETTATYIQETKEFEIHSPTFTASKWWIGGAGKLATHGVVQAKLILPDGKDVGPHLFFVQLRSLDDHRLLPGIETGDIGPKAMGAWSTTDNGFVRFNHVRIPAENMLSKFARVTDDGKYVQPPHAKISYGGMLYIRSTMVTTAGWEAAKASTIALRYAHARRQGNKGSDGLERQIITYPAVYHRLLPIMSRAYAFILLGRNLTGAFSAMSARLSGGDTSLLAELHATTSGLKGYVTRSTALDLETARRCMGGHGFSESAGLGRMYASYVPSATFEGDNFVLDLQVVRAAVKAYKNFSSAKNSSVSTLSPFTQFLRSLTEQPSTAQLKWYDPHTSVLLLERRALSMVREHARHEHDPDASAAQRVAHAVTEAFVAAQIAQFIEDLPRQLSGQNAHVISDVLLLCLLTMVESALADLLSFDLLPHSLYPEPRAEDGDRTRAARQAVKQQCLKLLPQAVALTDAFGYTDWELDSALGVYDGKVYEALWEKAQAEPLNEKEVVDGYEKYIKPILLRGQQVARQKAKL